MLLVFDVFDCKGLGLMVIVEARAVTKKKIKEWFILHLFNYFLFPMKFFSWKQDQKLLHFIVKG